MVVHVDDERQPRPRPFREGRSPHRQRANCGGGHLDLVVAQHLYHMVSDTEGV